jgi:hypothetical protein
MRGKARQSKVKQGKANTKSENPGFQEKKNPRVE